MTLHPQFALRFLLRAALIALAGALPVLYAQAADEHERMVVQYVGHQQGNEQGKKVMLVAVRSPANKAQIVLAVPNKDDKKPEYNPIDGVADPVKNLKPDDFVEIEFKPPPNRSQRPWLSSIKRYKAAEGELLPNVYLFQVGSRRQEGGKDFYGVVLRKLGETITAAVPGGSSPDQKMVASLESIKPQQAVEVTFASKGKIPVIATIDPYAPPETATVVKTTEVDLDGQKADAVELTVKNKPVTAIVSGKVVGKRWVPDPKVAAMAKRLKSDQAIEARLVQDGGKTWLRYFTPEKEKKSTTAGAEKSTAKDGGEKKDGAEKKTSEEKSNADDKKGAGEKKESEKK